QAVPDDLLPPQVVLELGHGMSRERALAVFALLRQMRIDACMIAIPGREKGETAYWVPGVLVAPEEKDHQGKPIRPGIYLFDTRLGIPLPGAGNTPVARLDRVIKDPAGHRALFPQGGDAVIPGQVAKAELLLACPLSALAPR